MYAAPSRRKHLSRRLPICQVPRQTAKANNHIRYGDNEDLLGKWFKANPDKRKDIFLATKFAVKEGHVIDSSPEYVKQASPSRSLLLPPC
jgi:hypothetical protein